jgi:hypothetical protein
VLAHGPYLLFCEVKANASGLGQAQLDAILEVCDLVEARPGIAALDGTFDEALAAQVRRRNGVVLQREQLLA